MTAITLSFAFCLASSQIPVSAYPRPGGMDIASLSSDGTQGTSLGPHRCDTFFGPPSITPNGRFVAFSTDLDGLASGDAPTVADIFIRDRQSGKTELISMSNEGLPALASPQRAADVLGGACHTVDLSTFPSISANGRHVAFASNAINLTPGDANETSTFNGRDIFVRDRKKLSTRVVSVSSTGEPAEYPDSSYGSHSPSISANGRYVAFTSSATNLVPDDTNGEEDVFVHDLKTGKTARASVASDGSQANSGSNYRPSISDSGRFVAFNSGGRLTPDDDAPLNRGGVFVRDMVRKTTTQVTLSPNGEETEGSISMYSEHAISGDGRFVVFLSSSSTYVPNDTNACLGDPPSASAEDVFVSDLKTHRTERVSISSDGSRQGESGSGAYGTTAISHDGRHVLYSTLSSTLDDGPGDERATCHLLSAPAALGQTGDEDLFVYDRKTGANQRITLGPNGSEPTCDASFLAGRWCQHGFGGLASGRYISVLSPAVDFVDGDRNNAVDVFVCDRGAALGARVMDDRSGGKGACGGQSLGKEQICVSPDTCVEPPEPICITPDVCIPPGGAIASGDDSVEADVVEGGDVTEAKVAYRPQYQDLFVTIELEQMPQVLPGAVSPVFYGLRFEVSARAYEVRATSLLGGTFGLFDCTGSFPACSKVADLRGGYGTTGMRLVFSLPLKEVGLENGGKLSDITVFSGLGNYLTGVTKVLDRMRIR